VEILVGWVAFAILGAVIAAAKGRNAIGFFFLGLFLSPLLSIIAALVVKPNQKYLEGESTLRMRVRLWELAAMKCLCCGCVMTLEDGKPNSCEIDEVRPRARGGNRTWDNVEPLCHKCNQERAIAAKRGERVEYSRDYRTTHPAFIAGCERELQRYERLRAERIRAQSGWSLPLFDCCVPS